MQLVNAYERREKLIIDSMSKTIHGVWISNGKAMKFDKAEGSGFGKGIVQSLDWSKMGVEHPKKWGSIHAALFDAANVKTWRDFVKGCICCEVESDGEIITITPTKNLGAADGFQIMNEKNLRLPAAASSEEVASMTLRALMLAL